MRVLALALLVALLLAPTSIPVGAAAPEPVNVSLHLATTGYEFSPAGSFRGAGYEAAAAMYGDLGVLVYRFLENADYAEGRAHIAFVGGDWFIAWVVPDYNIKQVSPPAPGPAGVLIAYSSYNNRLDVHAVIAGPEGYIQCTIADTGDWEEYPAAAWAGETPVVFFYNSSDRAYYATIIGSDCGATGLLVHDGSIPYYAAGQVTAASGGQGALLVFRDNPSGTLDAYAAVVYANATARVVELASGADWQVPAAAAYLDGPGLFLVPLTGPSLLLAEVWENATVNIVAEYSWTGGPARALALGSDTALVAVPGEEETLLLLYRYGDGVVAEQVLPATGAINVGYNGDLAIVTVGSKLYLLDPATLEVVQEVDYGVEIHGVLDVADYALLLAREAGSFTILDIYYHGAVPRERMIKLYTVPEDSEELLDPRNPYGFIGIIKSASSSVYAALAFFERTDVADAFIDAYQRGLEVGVVVDDDSLEYEAVQRMIEAGVPVYTDAEWENETGYRHTMHEKFIVADGTRVLIGTANPTWDGLERDYQNIIVLDNVPEIAFALTVEFEDLASGYYGTWDERDVYAGVVGYDPEQGVFTATVYQGPEHRLDHEYATPALVAESDLVMAQYIFTTSWRISQLREAILDALSRNVTVSGVFDWVLNEDTGGRFAYTLYAAGAEVVFSRGTAKMHAKTMVADYQTAVTGSYNPTGSATAYNDEVLIIYTGAAAAETAEWIHALIDMWSGDPWVVDYHPLITSFGVNPAFIVVYNPTPETLNLTQYLVGDAENLYRDTEAMLSFPGGVLEPGDYVIIAYNATEFTQAYGITPDYEIVDSTPEVPDMIPYLTERFAGDFNLDPAGDEVVLAMKSPYDPTFIYSIDVIPYGDSTMLPVDNAPAPTSGEPVVVRLGTLDSRDPATVTRLAHAPVGPVYSIIVEGRVFASWGQGAILAVAPEATPVSVARYLLPPPGYGEDAVAYDIYAAEPIELVAYLDIPPSLTGKFEAYALTPSGPVEVEIVAVNHGRIILDLTGIDLSGTPIVILTLPPTSVGGELASNAGGAPGWAPIAAVALSLAALAFALSRRS